MKHLQTTYLPDFLLTPYTLIADERVDAMDEKIYAVLYWYEHLKGGDCNPSNQEIARIVHASDETGIRSVQNSLTKLEQLGYIEREYGDAARRNRISIHTKVAYKYAPKPKAAAPVGFLQADEETPRDVAIKFFSGDEQTQERIIEDFAKTGDKQALEIEVKKFILYWTEPNGSGTKVRWQLQKTFDVKRRLFTWLSNKKGFAPAKSNGKKI